MIWGQATYIHSITLASPAGKIRCTLSVKEFWLTESRKTLLYCCPHPVEHSTHQRRGWLPGLLTCRRGIKTWLWPCVGSPKKHAAMELVGAPRALSLHFFNWSVTGLNYSCLTLKKKYFIFLIFIYCFYSPTFSCRALRVFLWERWQVYKCEK